MLLGSMGGGQWEAKSLCQPARAGLKFHHCRLFYDYAHLRFGLTAHSFVLVPTTGPPSGATFCPNRYFGRRMKKARVGLIPRVFVTGCFLPVLLVTALSPVTCRPSLASPMRREIPCLKCCFGYLGRRPRNQDYDAPFGQPPVVRACVCV